MVTGRVPLGLYTKAKHCVANKPFVYWIRFLQSFFMVSFIFGFCLGAWGLVVMRSSFEYGIPGLGIILVIIVGFSFVVLYNN